MGVNDLWQVLSPACENCGSLADAAALVAIDTSIWIRQSELVQGVKEANTLRPHVRYLGYNIVCGCIDYSLSNGSIIKLLFGFL